MILGGPPFRALMFPALLGLAGCSYLFDPGAAPGRHDSGPGVGGGPEDGGAVADGSVADGSVATSDAMPGASKTVFVTSSIFSGDLGGLDGADAKCQALANGAGLSGSYRAWLSADGKGPADRMTKSSLPYSLVNGEVVAQHWEELSSGSLQHALDRTELDTEPNRKFVCIELGYVWTNTTSSGEAGSVGDCVGWTSDMTGVGGGGVGAWEALDEHWTADECGPVSCITELPLYCIEQ